MPPSGPTVIPAARASAAFGRTPVAITTSSAGSVRRSVTTRRTFPPSPSSRSSDSPVWTATPLPRSVASAMPAMFASKSCGSTWPSRSTTAVFRFQTSASASVTSRPIAPPPTTTACSDLLGDQRPLEIEGVLQVVHEKDVPEVAPRHGRHGAHAPRGEHEPVVRQFAAGAAVEILDRHHAPLPVDRHGPRARQHGHALGLAEEARVAHRVEARGHQLGLVGDFVGEVVRDAAPAVGDEPVLVDDGDRGVGEQPAQATGDLRPEGDRPDDDDSQGVIVPARRRPRPGLSPC